MIKKKITLSKLWPNFQSLTPTRVSQFGQMFNAARRNSCVILDLKRVIHSVIQPQGGRVLDLLNARVFFSTLKVWIHCSSIVTPLHCPAPFVILLSSPKFLSQYLNYWTIFMDFSPTPWLATTLLMIAL